MNRSICIILLILGLVLSQKSFSQIEQLKIIKVPELENIVNSPSSEQIKIVNFWAPWCPPCIKELPYFVKAQEEFPEVDFVYISLDFSENASKAENLAKMKGLNPTGRYLIDDLDYNSWIDKVSPEWSGAIPATLIVKNGKKYLFEQEFEEGELSKVIKEKLN